MLSSQRRHWQAACGGGADRQRWLFQLFVTMTLCSNAATDLYSSPFNNDSSVHLVGAVNRRAIWASMAVNIDGHCRRPGSDRRLTTGPTEHWPCMSCRVSSPDRETDSSPLRKQSSTIYSCISYIHREAEKRTNFLLCASFATLN